MSTTVHRKLFLIWTKITEIPSFLSAMNHCNCWRWKMLIQVGPVSSAWEIYWTYGNAIGGAARANSTSISFGATIKLKYFLSTKFRRYRSGEISCCRQWHSFERLIALSFFTITQIRRRKWFISWFFCSTTTTNRSRKAFSMSWW